MKSLRGILVALFVFAFLTVGCGDQKKGTIEVEVHPETTAPVPSEDGSIACAGQQTIWSTVGGACDVTVEYWATEGCRANLTPRGGASSGQPTPDASGGPGGKRSSAFTNVTSVVLHCIEGTPPGKCFYRLERVVATGVTPREEEGRTDKYECGSGPKELVHAHNPGCDVTVRATAPAGCTAEVWEEGGAHQTPAGGFITFTGTTKKVFVSCLGSGSGSCTFEYRAQCR